MVTKALTIGVLEAERRVLKKMLCSRHQILDKGSRLKVAQLLLHKILKTGEDSDIDEALESNLLLGTTNIILDSILIIVRAHRLLKNKDHLDLKNSLGEIVFTLIMRNTIDGTILKELVKALIDAGADPNVEGTPDKDMSTTLAKTSLYWARGDIVELLLNAGADPNTLSSCGETVLHFTRDPTIAELLLQAGADINTRDTKPRQIQTLKSFSIFVCTNYNAGLFAIQPSH